MPADDNVVKMPDRLERRAQKIEAAMARRAKGDEEWIEGTIELAVELAGARDDHSGDREFGRWLDGRFGDNRLPKDEQSALIQWGRDPAQTRIMLEKAETRSIQMIHRSFRNATKERFHSTGKTTTPKREQAEASIREHKARTGSYPSVIEAGEESGLSRIVIEPALAAVKAEDRMAPSELRFIKAQDLHVEARIRALDKEREKTFDERVRLGVLERNAGYLAALEKLEKEASEKRERYDTLINSYRPIFTDTEFTVILTCLHPDNSASPEKRDTAFKAFNAMKLQLTGKK